MDKKTLKRKKLLKFCKSKNTGLFEINDKKKNKIVKYISFFKNKKNKTKLFILKFIKFDDLYKIYRNGTYLGKTKSYVNLLRKLSEDNETSKKFLKKLKISREIAKQIKFKELKRETQKQKLRKFCKKFMKTKKKGKNKNQKSKVILI